MAALKTHVKFDWSLLAYLAPALFLLVGLLILEDKYIEDEFFHYPQIRNFLNGNFALRDDITQLPGYHIVVFVVAKLGRAEDLTEVRIASSVLHFACYILLVVQGRMLKIKDIELVLLCVFFLPILSFFIPLVYTEFFALTLVLSGLMWAMHAKHLFAAVCFTSAFLVRQDTIIFAAIVPMADLIGQFAGGKRPPVRELLRTNQGLLFYALPFSVVLLFLVYNQGDIAVGDKHDHPLGFYFESVTIFMAFSTAVVWPFVSMSRARRRLQSLRPLLPAIIALIVIFVIGTWSPDHHSNFTEPFVRNAFIEEVQDHIVLYTVVLIVLFMLGGFCCLGLELKKPEYWIFLPLGLIALALHTFVEPRYFIPVFAILLVLMKPDRKHLIQAALYYAILSVYFSFRSYYQMEIYI